MTKSVAQQIKKINSRRYYDRPPRVESLIADACEHHNVSRRDVLSGHLCHAPRVVRAREEVCVELRKMNWSYKRIGRAVGGIHHTTVMTALQRAGAAPLTGRVVFDVDFSVPDESGIWAI